jgi:DNA polymerase
VALSWHEQVQAHLAAWRQAGVQLVPRAFTPPEVAAPQNTPTPAEAQESVSQELVLLHQDIRSCEKCPGLFATRSQPIVGQGPVQADLCVIVAAPSAADDASGRPLSDDAGVVVDRMLAAIGYERSEVYVTTVAKCLPPSRPPSPGECRNCRPFLERELALVRPKAILVLGETASQAFCETDQSLLELRAESHRLLGIPVFCTYHPQEWQRQPAWKKACWDDLQHMVKQLAKVPASSEANSG